MGTEHKHRVCTFQEAKDAIKRNKKIYINDCFCRGPAKKGETSWEYCGHEIDTCMGFYEPSGDDMDYTYREIGRKEALQKFEEWKRQGNFFRFMEDEKWICSCCACGCGWFRDKEGNLVQDPCDKSPFIERTTLSMCALCGECIDVCAYKARKIEDNTVTIESEKCYGCSACEYACPENAIKMVPRE